MEITKEFINPLLFTLASYESETGKPVSGLLFEEIGLGLRRKLQKIHKELAVYSNEMKSDGEEITKRLDGNEEEIEKELKILISEKVTLNCESATISEIEKIISKTNYDFTLIEMIAK